MEQDDISTEFNFVLLYSPPRVSALPFSLIRPNKKRNNYAVNNDRVSVTSRRPLCWLCIVCESALMNSLLMIHTRS